MIILKNILTKKTLENCSKDLKENSMKKSWSSNHTLWSKPLLNGTFGACLFSEVNDQLKIEIFSEISDKIPKVKKMSIQHYVWLPGSGISPHTDSNYTFGMTIYLCDTKYEDGGILIWKNGEEYQAHFPEYNSAALNETKSLHMITPVSLTTKTNRHTLQIWGF